MQPSMKVQPTQEETGIKVVSPETIKSGVYKLSGSNLEYFNANKKLPTDLAIGCIDGRRGGEAGENIICVPGGGFGILADTLSAYADVKGVLIQEDADKVLEIVKETLGGKISGHTDLRSHGNSFCYAGCGHANGALNNASYIMNNEAKNYLKTLSGKVVDDETFPVAVYPGDHKEIAVLAITNMEDASTTYLKSDTDPNGNEKTQTFVYNTGWHEEILKVIASKIKDADILAKLLETKNANFTVTANKLTSNIPAENKVAI